MSTTLDSWRKEIDALDKELLTVLSKRMGAVREIGKIKKEQGIPVLDKKRWQEVIESRTNLGNRLGFNKSFILSLWEIIHKESLKVEEKI